jgi:hypothetical protein
MFLALLAIILLGAFISAQVVVTQKNLQQSNFVISHSELYKYAESGVDLARHDLRYHFSGNDGNMGCLNWVLAGDLGRDGMAGTGDEGEGDGLPTPGEPNVAPVPIGASALHIGLVVHVEDTAYAGVKRLVGTATDGEILVTVERYDLETTPTIPRTGAFYVEPDVTLDFRSQAVRIDGSDHNPDGTAGSDAPLPGMATTSGEEAGVLSQVPLKCHDQVQGEGGDASVGAAPEFNFPQLFEGLKASATQEIAPGTYSSGTDFGDWSTRDLPVTYVKGDLALEGQIHGAGVLIVDGTLEMTGQSEFVGLVIVNGDALISGGGAGIHVWGSIMIGQSDPTKSSMLTVAGTADIFYSSAAMGAVEASLPPDHQWVYYEEK